MSSTAERMLKKLKADSLTLVLAESCTGGLVAGALAKIPGASEVFWGAFISYTLDAKRKMLGVDAGILEKYGAVSSETAAAMVYGALEKSGAGIALAVTGLAGPDGDGSDTPLGTVWFGIGCRGKNAKTIVYHFEGDREAVRTAAAGQALALIEEFLLHEAGIISK